jgi:hypothetical protein
MRTIRDAVAGTLALLLCLSSSVLAQERHAVPPAALAEAVAQHSASQDRDRVAVQEALSRPEVRAIANRTGIDIERVAAAVDTLGAEDLARAADAARDVNDVLVGGANTITISTTTIIIVLLVVILILVAD